MSQPDAGNGVTRSASATVSRLASVAAAWSGNAGSEALPRLPGIGGATASRDDAGGDNLLLLVQLRWIAVAGQIATMFVASFALSIDLPALPMAAVLACLVALNAASLFWIARGRPVTENLLFAALVLDVAALTAQLYLSGGATNPFTCLFLLQITLGAVLLDRRLTGALVGLTLAAIVLLNLSYLPLVLHPDNVGQLFELYLLGMLIGLMLNSVLIAVFVSRISRNLRERDARLADLRQRAAEEDHIVRMGLLASGAAHELGTPLASMSVLLGDWRRMPALTGSADLVRDIAEMEDALARCKAIVTGILLAAGAPRGESSHLTSVRQFVGDLVADWRRDRSCETLALRDTLDEDRPIVSDAALRQVVYNVLDNAYEVSPQELELVLACHDEALHICVLDRGPGFAPEVLERLGQPYISTKGRLGGGLGLFLVVNVVRKLGGSILAHNREGGGASVTIVLPLHLVGV